MSGSVVSALNILYEICPWIQTWFYTSAQNLLDQKDLLGSQNGPLINIAIKNGAYKIKRNHSNLVRCKWEARQVFHNLALFFPKLLTLYEFLHFRGKPPIKRSNKAECFSLTNMLKKRWRMHKSMKRQHFKPSKLMAFENADDICAGLFDAQRPNRDKTRTRFLLIFFSVASPVPKGLVLVQWVRPKLASSSAISKGIQKFMSSPVQSTLDIVPDF